LVFNGGEAEATVRNIVWTSWGGSQAIGSGLGYYYKTYPPDGHFERATIVAFDLGTCSGALEYRAVEWYFPEQGESFNPGQYEDICNGGYVPRS
jgi:hypothetical protein